jgi:hypothetical protein
MAHKLMSTVIDQYKRSVRLVAEWDLSLQSMLEWIDQIPVGNRPVVRGGLRGASGLETERAQQDAWRAEALALAEAICTRPPPNPTFYAIGTKLVTDLAGRLPALSAQWDRHFRPAEQRVEDDRLAALAAARDEVKRQAEAEQARVAEEKAKAMETEEGKAAAEAEEKAAKEKADLEAKRKAKARKEGRPDTPDPAALAAKQEADEEAQRQAEAVANVNARVLVARQREMMTVVRPMVAAMVERMDLRCQQGEHGRAAVMAPRPPPTTGVVSWSHGKEGGLVPPQLTCVRQAVATDAAALFVLDDGQLCQWVPNAAPSLDGPAPNDADVQPVMCVASLNVQSVAVTTKHTYLLDELGRVFRSDLSASLEPMLVGVADASVFVAVAVTTESENGIALTENGRVVTWGSNACGECGDGQTGVAVDTPAVLPASSFGTPYHVCIVCGLLLI